MLDAQDDPNGVRLVLWNNCKPDRTFYVEAIKSFHPVGSLRQVDLVQSPVNAGGMGRFYVARALARENGAGPVVFLDDDQDVGPRFVADCVRSYRHKSVSGWWAWRILEDYFQREPVVCGEAADYVGTGGMVIDRSLFLESDFFSGLPTRYWFIEDLWLSDYARRKGWPLHKLDTAIEFVMDETNQNHQLAGLKPEFFRWLASQRHTPLH
ncbi:hypothetical protein [Lysinibacter cavernae]|uniref:GT2 family glycosyltransferase n=1 Tax=Lysinibacter cavernae TaxID=1640652 RepID=A0A7X5TUB3_9MICO|nr:hypothetical protein [Lysinibacter cavernae]NIH55105.1 GT2 family glycosyltransferase [Lysinibacter cavernae]